MDQHWEEASRRRVTKLFPKRGPLSRARDQAIAWLTKHRKALDQALPERQIFIRSRGQVKFFALSGQKQLALALIPASLLLMLIFGGIGLALQGSWLASRNAEYASLDNTQRNLRKQRDGLVTDLAESGRRHATTVRNFDRRHATTVKGLNRRHATTVKGLNQRYDTTVEGLNQRYDTTVKGLNQRYATTVKDLDQRYASIVGDLGNKHKALSSVLNVNSQLNEDISTLKVELSALDRTRTTLSGESVAHKKRFLRLRERLTRTSSLRDEPTGSLRAAPLRLRLSLGDGFAQEPRSLAAEDRPRTTFEFEASQRLLALTKGERDQSREHARALDQQMRLLENRLTDLQQMQESLIARIEGGTEAHISELEKVIMLTGLDPERLLNRAEGPREGVGGPLIRISAPDGETESRQTPETHPETANSLEDQFGHAVNRMGVKIARWSALNSVTERLPLAAPVRPYRITSRFGKRRDPYTKRWAKHEGIDMTAPRKSSILATAPGRVTKAAWKGPYGRMIEIDHGYGLKTRYGHLYRIMVKRGDSVVKGQKIGIIGSSGRSTGRHLHYEVRYDNRPLNPKTFLKAGDHVFKIRQK